jgi:hypothetical protein
MTSAADTYIEAQVRSALYELNLIGNPDSSLATRLIEALDDRGIELRPR